MESLAGKVVVITGGASGIGLAMAKLFAAEGASIALADIAGGAVEIVAAELAATGAEVLAVPTDVADAASVSAFADRVMDRFGAVHVVCNNAGVGVFGPAWKISLDDWRRCVDVNLWGLVHGINTFVPLIRSTGERGHVVNTASMAGVTTIPMSAPYAATKHAVVAISEVLHHDLAAIDAPVGVTVVCPGGVLTHLGEADKLAPLRELPPGYISAEQVAADVRAAMAEERFYVFTHAVGVSEVEQRMKAMIDGKTPALRPPG
jgi:NAD(P)-dependent dehydrogenase (short-subunit alcohol dehydrogenase family)